MREGREGIFKRVIRLCLVTPRKYPIWEKLLRRRITTKDTFRTTRCRRVRVVVKTALSAKYSLLRAEGFLKKPALRGSQ